MKKKWENIGNNLLFLLTLFFLVALTEVIVRVNDIPKYILPAPSKVLESLIKNKDLLLKHTLVTLYESLLGFFISIILSFVIGALIYNKKRLKAVLYPFLLISQTIPLIAIAPIILIWLGFGIMPKIVIVVVICVFPMLINFLEGLDSVDKELIDLMKVMRATKREIFLKGILPSSLGSFFAGAKISATYAIMGAVIGEWLGAKNGLGIYMTRALTSFKTDGLFAAILIVILLSILLFKIIEGIEYLIMPWRDKE